jgi:hypothetical protein
VDLGSGLSRAARGLGCFPFLGGRGRGRALASALALLDVSTSVAHPALERGRKLVPANLTVVVRVHALHELTHLLLGRHVAAQVAQKLRQLVGADLTATIAVEDREGLFNFVQLRTSPALRHGVNCPFVANRYILYIGWSATMMYKWEEDSQIICVLQ